MQTIKAQFRYIYFPKTQEYVGFAWEYNHAVMVSTRPQKSYTEASLALIRTIDQLNVDCPNRGYITLAYFDGEYEIAGNGEQLISLKFEDIVNTYSKPFT